MDDKAPRRAWTGSPMAAASAFVLLLSALVAADVQAADAPPAADAPKVAVIVELRRDPVVFYATADRSSPSISLPKAQVTLPLIVLDEDGDFVQVRINGSDRWVSVLAVRFERRSIACGAQKAKVLSDYAASRGAGEPCK